MLTCTSSHYITDVKQEDFLYDRMFEYLADKRTERKTSLLKINKCGRTAADRHTDTQTRVTTIHFASSTTHAECMLDYSRQKRQYDKRTERKTSLLKINAILSLLTAIMEHYILRESPTLLHGPGCNLGQW